MGVHSNGCGGSVAHSAWSVVHRPLSGSAVGRRQIWRKAYCSSGKATQAVSCKSWCGKAKAYCRFSRCAGRSASRVPAASCQPRRGQSQASHPVYRPPNQLNQSSVSEGDAIHRVALCQHGTSQMQSPNPKPNSKPNQLVGLWIWLISLIATCSSCSSSSCSGDHMCSRVYSADGGAAVVWHHPPPPAGTRSRGSAT